MPEFVVDLKENLNDLVGYLCVFESVFICVHLWLNK